MCMCMYSMNNKINNSFWLTIIIWLVVRGKLQCLNRNSECEIIKIATEENAHFICVYAYWLTSCSLCSFINMQAINSFAESFQFLELIKHANNAGYTQSDYLALLSNVTKQSAEEGVAFANLLTKGKEPFVTATSVCDLFMEMKLDANCAQFIETAVSDNEWVQRAIVDKEERTRLVGWSVVVCSVSSQFKQILFCDATSVCVRMLCMKRGIGIIWNVQSSICCKI